MKITEFWNSRTSSQRDAMIASLLVGIAYLVVLQVNLAETLAAKFALYESIQLDEIPFLLLLIAIALAWFSRRRAFELNNEIKLRIVADGKIMQLLVENKALTQHVLKVQEVERLQLARDLHDDIGQYLLAIRLDASALSFSTSNHEEMESFNLYTTRILSNADHIQKMTRVLMKRLRPAPTNSQSCTEAINQLIQEWHAQHPKITLQLNIEQCSDRFTEEINVSIYRFIQEALTNISKHADASNVIVSLNLNEGESGQLLCLEIADDGIGIKSKSTPYGMGIIGMRERIDAVRGEFFVKSEYGHGVAIYAKIPI